MSVSGPESQDSLFIQPEENIPPTLARASQRLQFPPLYVIVGVYRLFTDKLLYVPAWNRCKHVQKGALVGAVWTFLTFKIQRKFIKIFLANSPRVTGLIDDTMFGYKIPFNVHTYAAVLFLGSQVTYILRFTLSKNIRIAREHVWDQTVASRGKGQDFWQPYVEEWKVPPVVDVDSKSKRFANKLLGGWVRTFIIKRILLLPFNFYPFVGVVVAAWFKALGTSRKLHKQYFKSKKMTDREVAVFIEERKWDYRTFGFAAALLEGLPIIGLVFTISNGVGAAMWAHDLEKRQRFVASERSSVGKQE